MHARTLIAPLCASLAIVACAKSVPEQTFLQADDLASGGEPFDKNEIVDTGSFTDARGLDVTEIQQFFEQTPYKRASFLATYQSNGVRAADAIVAASMKYQINPLVFLVRAEIAEGLIGEQFYPAPPSRVEYVFGCGCSGAGPCEAELAGFDLQVDCLGRALRASLDEIAQNGQTAGGWGPNVTSSTVDGEKVTPRDEATAALYQYEPKVGTGSGGNWLFFNVWQNYAGFVSYTGPIGPATGSAYVGDACKSDAVCGFPNALCATNYPGGMCTAPCNNDCPTDPGRPAVFCADFQQSGYCLLVCDPNMPGACRDGYACKSLGQLGAPMTTQFVCVNK
jgi:hypothetical protein